MFWEEILKNPWFYSSPSPMSIIYHGLIILWGAYVLRKRINYKKHPVLISLTDSFLIVGFIVLTGDTIWMALCGLRFLPQYPNNLFLVVSTLGRNLAGMAFCFLLQFDKLGKVIKPKGHTFVAYFFLVAWLGVNFLVAPNPSWTDYTFAIRQNCSIDYILKAFLVNWVGGKILTAIVIYSWFKSDSNNSPTT